MLVPRLHRAHAFPWDAHMGDTRGRLPLFRAWRHLKMLGAHASTQILPGPWGWGLGAAVSSRS